VRVVCYHMYQVFKPTILNSHSLWLMESQSKSTAKPQSLRQAPVHCDSISKLPVITSRCKSTCDQQNAKDGNTQGSPFGRFAWPCVFPSPAFNSLPAERDYGIVSRIAPAYCAILKTLSSFSLNAAISCPILSLVIRA
jgi:hypothetical protein